MDRNLGELIVAFFDQDGLANEAGLSGGDSGGGMFIKIHQQWYIAGISYSAGGEFKVRESDAPFKAMLFDNEAFIKKEGPLIQGKYGFQYLCKINLNLGKSPVHA